MKKVLPILFLLLGLLGGGGAAFFLSPPAEPNTETDDVEPAPPDTEPGYDPTADYEYVRLNNQFVIPVVRDGRVQSLVVLSITLEASQGSRADIYAREPRVRDALLSVLFEHSNAGGFDGVFTENLTLRALRRSLRDAARTVMGEVVNDVLVMDIVRQDTS